MTQTKVEAPFVANNFAHFKNLVINGDFRVFQRTESSTAVGNGTYSTADQFKTNFSNDGAATTQKHTLSDADRATTGHPFAWQWDVGTADGTIASNQSAYFRHFIEAQNCSGLAYGSSAAKTLTLSFWVKSSKTGTYSCTIAKEDSTAYYLPLEYAISSADTWEFKTLVVSPTAGSTSLITGSAGDIAQDNGKGITLYWWLAAGSDITGGTNNTWGSNSDNLTTTNQVNWLDSTSNNFYITGIQFEIGDQATDFEHLPFDVQLNRCLRYYYDLASTGLISPSAPTYICNCSYWNSGQVFGFLHFPTVMRTEPTLTTTNATNTFYAYVDGSGDGLDDLTLNSQSNFAGVMVQNSTDASGTGGEAGGLYLNSGKICNFSAEL